MTAWRLFPYPTLYVARAESIPRLEDGSLVAVPTVCRSCPTTECKDNTRTGRGEISECRYGVNYARIDNRRLVIGILASELPGATRQLKRRARKSPELRVRPRQVRDAIATAADLGPGVVADFEREKQEVLRGLKDDPGMFNALAQQLRNDFQETIGQSHDLLQLVKLVKGYAEVLLQARAPDLTTEQAAEKYPTEGSIFFASELMLVKMDSLVFLHEINVALGGETRFQIHPFVLKYVRIYRWQAQQKNLDLQLVGQSYGWCRYNSQAIGAVIQALLDNLVKYAPSGSKATISFEEGDDQVSITFTSLGPRIEDDELNKIFLPGVRAVAARGVASSGLGLGLATGKQVSDALDLELEAAQNSVQDAKYLERFETTFRLTLTTVRAAANLP
jgi:signal transduction histidine kinase